MLPLLSPSNASEQHLCRLTVVGLLQIIGCTAVSEPIPGRAWTSIPHEMKGDAADAGSVQVARFRHDTIVTGSASVAAWPGHGLQQTLEALVAGVVSPTLAGRLITRRSRAPRGASAMAVAALSRRPHPDRARRARSAGSTVEPRCGSDLAVPARLVGWSEPGNQAKGGDTSLYYPGLQDRPPGRDAPNDGRGQ